MEYFDQNRRPIIMSPNLLGGGGEANIYQVMSHPYRKSSDLVAKIYKEIKPSQQEKLSRMISHSPQASSSLQEHISFAWPKHLIFDSNNNWVGFLMPHIRNSHKLFNVYNPKQRKLLFSSQFNREYLYHTALNLVYALREIHALDYVIGDLNESNVLVNPNTLVTIIDNDSFQLKINHPGRIEYYPCPVGKVEFTPPEFQGKEFTKKEREFETDNFSLGVLIYMLIMDGNHPFRAYYRGKGDPPSISKKITEGWFPYSQRNKEIAPCSNIPPLHTLHPKLEKLILNCFIEGHENPIKRPNPEQWIDGLQQGISALKPCNKGHFYSSHLTKCPECFPQSISRRKPVPVDQRTPPLYGINVRKTQLDFGKMAFGETQEKRFYLTNTGQAPLNVRIKLLLLNPPGNKNLQPSIQIDTFEIKLSPGKREPISLIITAPSNTGLIGEENITSRVEINSEAGTNTFNVKYIISSPIVAINTSRLDLGQVDLGDQVNGNINIRNTGLGHLSGSLTSRDRWIDINPNRFGLLKNEIRKIKIEVDTKKLSLTSKRTNLKGEITIKSNGGDSDIEVSLIVKSPILQLSRTDLSYGVLSPGESISKSFSIINSGLANLIGSIKCQDPWVKIDKRDFDIPPNQRRSITIRVNPSSLDASNKGTDHSSSLIVDSNGGRDKLKLSLILAKPDLMIIKNIIDFGSIQQGDSKTEIIEIQNNGRVDIKGFLLCDQEWVRIPKQFKVPVNSTKKFPISIKPSNFGVPLNRKLIPKINIKSNAGNHTVGIKVQIQSSNLKIRTSDFNIPRRESDADFIESELIIKNIGQDIGKISLSSNSNWLKVEPPTAIVNPGESEICRYAVSMHELELNQSLLSGRLIIKTPTFDQKIFVSVDKEKLRDGLNGSITNERREIDLRTSDQTKITFVRIPAGSFIMGVDRERIPDMGSSASPKQKIYLHEYWLAKYPLTNEQYEVFLNATGYQEPSNRSLQDIRRNKSHPVTGVNWMDAITFCKWVSDITGSEVRLPTEAEWERAARGSDERIYPWGNETAESHHCNFNSSGTTQVGTFSPEFDSPYGCADMIGNVWEWSNSLYKPYPYNNRDGREEISNPGPRVLRGGSWMSLENEIYVNFRKRLRRESCSDAIGFRCALSY